MCFFRLCAHGDAFDQLAGGGDRTAEPAVDAAREVAQGGYHLAGRAIHRRCESRISELCQMRCMGIGKSAKGLEPDVRVNLRSFPQRNREAEKDDYDC
jgi:hypothetical protein